MATEFHNEYCGGARSFLHSIKKVKKNDHSEILLDQFEGTQHQGMKTGLIGKRVGQQEKEGR